MGLDAQYLFVRNVGHRYEQYINSQRLIYFNCFELYREASLYFKVMIIHTS
jgi:hypothetical protein